MTKQKKLWLGIFTFLPTLFIILYLVSFFFMFMGITADQIDESDPAGFFASFGLMFIFLLFAILLGLGVMIYYIIHAANNKAFSDTNRLIWILVLIFASGVGSIVYFFVNIYPLPDPSTSEIQES